VRTNQDRLRKESPVRNPSDARTLMLTTPPFMLRCAKNATTRFRDPNLHVT
jgi:hypothetical protein